MLSLKNIVLSRGRRIVIEGLSAGGQRGDLIALLGPNGAGKTTLLHFIAGLLKEDSGAIFYRGNKIEPSSSDWRRRLTYVLDDGGTIPLLTVEEQIYLQCALTGINQAESIQRTKLVIDLFGLNGYRDCRADELSSGLRKRLGIGLGIVRDADIFLFDEPLGALDVQGMVVFSRILMTLKEGGRIVLVASHSFPLLHELCNRAWALANGVVTDHTDRHELNNILVPPFPSGSSCENTDPGLIDLPWILNSK